MNNRRLFSSREVRALALCLPALVVVFSLLFAIRSGKRVSEESVLQLEEALSADVGAEESGRGSSVGLSPDSVVLHKFDPNRATYEEFRSLGLSAQVAASVVKYRERGKVFEIPEDFATCYGITDSIYARLKPYIEIGEEFALKPWAERTGDEGDTPRAEPRKRLTPTQKAEAYLELHPVIDPNLLSAEDLYLMGCTARQAEAVVAWRDDRGGFRSVAEVEECRYLPLEVFDVVAEALVINIGDQQSSPEDGSVELAVRGEGEANAGGGGLLDLNSADFDDLVAVRGIGEQSATDILAYRERLGGYARVEQLAELAVVTEKNYEMIVQQIFVDSCKIQKIDINFAGPESLSSHPYMTSQRIRKILKNRQLKGGWSTIEDMIEDHTLTPEEAQRLSPYLRFSPKE